MDKTKPFKQQFNDNSVYITEYTNQYNEHLILAKYNMYDTDMYTNRFSIYREARSLVIDLNQENIVLCPFKKFFNINEIPGETDVSTVFEQIQRADLVEITDKLDGSIIIARWYNNHIILSTSASLDKNLSPQLAEAYQLFSNNYVQLCRENPSYTFMFEAILQSDKHVVNYTDDQLYLIGARNIYNGTTLTYSEINNLGKQYNLLTVLIENISLATCLHQQSLYKATDKEGWVIYIRIHGKEYRYKLKCDDYVAMHKLLSGNNTNDLLIYYVAEGKEDDLLSKIDISYRQQFLEKINLIKQYVNTQTQTINSLYESIPQNLDKKDFALYVQNNIPHQYRSYMYKINQNKPFDILKKNTNSYIKWENICAI